MCMYMNNHAQYFKVRVMQSKDSCMLGGGFPKDLGVRLLLWFFIHVTRLILQFINVVIMS